MRPFFVLVFLAMCTVVHASSYTNKCPLSANITSKGKSITLNCPIDLDPGSKLKIVYWMKDGINVYSLSVETNKSTNSTKYEIEGTSLTISNMEEGDRGNYSCRYLTNAAPPDSTIESSSIPLFVTVLTVSHCKDDINGYDDSSCLIYGGNTTNLNCSTSGFPTPSRTVWHLNRKTSNTSVVDLSKYDQNMTMLCVAWDEPHQCVWKQRAVEVYYHDELGRTKHRTNHVAIIVPIVVFVIVVFVIVVVPCLCLLYKYRKCFPTCGISTRHAALPTKSDSPDTSRREMGTLKEEDLQNSNGSHLDLEPNSTSKSKLTRKTKKNSLMREETEQAKEPLPLVGSVLLGRLQKINDDKKRRNLKNMVCKVLGTFYNAAKDKDINVRRCPGAPDSDRLNSDNGDESFVLWVVRLRKYIAGEQQKDKFDILVSLYPDMSGEFPEIPYMLEKGYLSEKTKPSPSRVNHLESLKRLTDCFIINFKNKTTMEKQSIYNDIAFEILSSLSSSICMTKTTEDMTLSHCDDDIKLLIEKMAKVDDRKLQINVMEILNSSPKTRVESYTALPDDIDSNKTPTINSMIKAESPKTVPKFNNSKDTCLPKDSNAVRRILRNTAPEERETLIGLATDIIEESKQPAMDKMEEITELPDQLQPAMEENIKLPDQLQPAMEENIKLPDQLQPLLDESKKEISEIRKEHKSL